MSKKPVLVIMAAGMGSRYGGLKQLDPVGAHQQMIIDYSIYDARRAGFETVVFVIKPEIEADFKTLVGERVAKAMDVKYVHQRKEDLPAGYSVPQERTKPWGTAQAALAARDVVDGPFAIINADDYYGPEAFRQIFDYLSAHADGGRYEYAMVGYLLKNTVTENGAVARGVCEETEDHFLTRVTERTKIEKGEPPRYTEDDGKTWTDLPGDTIVSMNMWGFTRSFLDEAWERFPAFLDKALAENPAKAEYFLPTVVSQLIDEDKARVKVLRSEDKWYGVTYREDKPAVVQAIADMTASGLYPEKLWEVERMSPAAFKRPDQLMENIIGVTEYLGREIASSGGDRSREALEVLRPRNGAPYYTDTDGGAWRVYPFVEGTICYQTAETPELFAASGRAFGRFQRLLQGYPAATLHETIPHFHDTEDRLAKLKAAVAADSLGRVKECRKEIDFMLAREADCSVALRALRDGLLPLRVTHNDTKLNNVLMDAQTGQGLCIIDLDTVMPGLSINDFGDSIRFGANHSAEDERDLSKVNLDVNLFEVYAAAFLEGAGGTLTDKEIEMLPWGAKLMTLECGIRFLTDYLVGDQYFHISREGQNLDRCRTQCKLVADMEDHWDELAAIVAKYR